jgi:hypothetical protein
MLNLKKGSNPMIILIPIPILCLLVYIWNKSKNTDIIIALVILFMILCAIQCGLVAAVLTNHNSVFNTIAEIEIIRNDIQGMKYEEISEETIVRIRELNHYIIENKINNKNRFVDVFIPDIIEEVEPIVLFKSTYTPFRFQPNFKQ